MKSEYFIARYDGGYIQKSKKFPNTADGKRLSKIWLKKLFEDGGWSSKYETKWKHMMRRKKH